VTGSSTALLTDHYELTMVEAALRNGTGHRRAVLDELGAAKTRIVVTSDLDEFQLAALAAAPMDAYGVGTALVTGSGAPTAGMVYKLVARSESNAPEAPLLPVAKRSLAKAGLGGRKWAVRDLDSIGTATAETIGTTAAPPDHPTGGHRELLRPLIRAGEVIGRESLTAARDRHYAALQELPATAHQLSRGEPAIRTRHVEESR
jgi:nicotinate phosphoribosyltransferase